MNGVSADPLQEMPPQKIIRRAHNIAHWMFTEATAEIIKISKVILDGSQLLDDIVARDREVDRLHVVCQRGLNKAILNTDFRARINMRRGDMSDYFRTMDYIELMADFSYELAKSGKILGMASISFNLALRYNGEYCQLEELVVDPEARGKNVGGLLIEETIRLANIRGCKEYGLYILESTKHNQGFYAYYIYRGHCQQKPFS